MTDNTSAIRLLLDKGMAEDAARLYPMEQAKADADGDVNDALAAFALASYYYYGVGGRQVIHSAMDYGLLAIKRGYPDAAKTVAKWKRDEKRKNVVYMVYLFEMCLCIPFFIVLAEKVRDITGMESGRLQTVSEVLYVVPVIVGVVIIRSFLKRMNVGKTRLHWWNYVLFVLLVPLMLLAMAVPYVLLVYAARLVM